MSWRLRKTVALPFPGLRLNIGKTGVSLSFAPIPGMTLNLGKNGAQVTGSLPGTGVSATHKIKK